jgi:hypothetical protein
MNRDPRAWIPAIVAGFLLALVAGQTVIALQHSGRLIWNHVPKFAVNPADPYNRLELLLSEPDHPPELSAIRDPFQFGRGPVRPTHVAGTPEGPKQPPPASPRPVLTAIISDPTDPRAIVVYENHNYSVRAGDLFAEYKVVSISPDGVVLDNGRERLTLQRPTKGR